ncbi:hypothetical protein [Micromonospora sp. NPDC005707]
MFGDIPRELLRFEHHGAGVLVGGLRLTGRRRGADMCTGRA